jgi:hypothetical protein
MIVIFKKSHALHLILIPSPETAPLQRTVCHTSRISFGFD